MLRLWRSALALAALLVPPALVTAAVWYLYRPSLLVLPVSFAVIAFVWADALRGLRSRQ